MRFAQWLCRCRRARPDGRKNVFVYCNDLFGDGIMRLPFFLGLRKTFLQSDYHITAVVSSGMSELLSCFGCFDEIVEEGKLQWRHPLFWFFSPSGMAKSVKWAFCHKAEVFIDCLRFRSFGVDCAFLLCRPVVSCAYASEIGFALFPFLYQQQYRHYDKLYTHLISPAERRHQLDDMTRLISLLAGRPVQLSMPDLDDLLPIASSPLDLPRQNYVVLVPGAGAEYRKWPIERFANVARRLGGDFVVVGTKDESPLAIELSKILGDGVVDLCGKTTLLQLAGVLKNSKVVITNETGTATYAAILGVPTVCILGGGDFGAFFPNPFCRKTVSVYQKEDCFGCGWKCTKKHPHSTVAPCIESLTVDEVLKAVQQAVAQNEQAPNS